MFKRVLFLCLMSQVAGSVIFADPPAAGTATPATPAFDPVKHWEADFETGLLWRVTGSATPLTYVLQPQFLTVKSPAVMSFSLGGGDLVFRNRFSLLLEPIVIGPEHHYYGLSGSGILEWWDLARTRCLFFSSGGGFGWLDSKGYEIAGAQGQEFNLNWFAYTGARFRCSEKWSASAGLFFQHISNGHLDKVDPGLNSLGPMLSIGWCF